MLMSRAAKQGGVGEYLLHDIEREGGWSYLAS